MYSKNRLYYLHKKVRDSGYKVKVRQRVILIKSYHIGNKYINELRYMYGYSVQLEV